MALIKSLDWLLRKISYLGFLAASALLLVVGIMGTVDVISTNVFLRPIPGMVELSGALLAVIVLLGLAEAQARGAHIFIDIVTAQMPPAMQKLSLIFSLTVGMVFMGFIAIYTTKLALDAWSFRETALGALAFPVAPFKSLAAFGAWLSAAEFARQLIVRIITPAHAREVSNA